MITAQPDALKMFYQLLQGRILSYGHILIRSENKDKPSVKEVSIIPPSKRRSKIHPVLDQWAMNPELITIVRPQVKVGYNRKIPPNGQQVATEELLKLWRALMTLDTAIAKALDAIDNPRDKDKMALDIHYGIAGLPDFQAFGITNHAMVIGFDPQPTDPQFKDQAIIVCRHYTNLLGWYRYGDILMAKLIG